MTLALRSLLALVFLASGLAKLVDFDASAVLLADLLGRPEAAVRPGLGALILVELLLAAALAWIPFGGRVEFGASLLATLGFLAVSVALLLAGAESCGCFGARFAVSAETTIAKNVLLVGISGLLLHRARSAPPGPPRRGDASRHRTARHDVLASH